ncbi:MAG TPA: hypothetical protein VFE44_01800, partial [Thermoanaerobaculia bacterium]|nr:hypothetical protein [Thermoanaerobaculia bacterium]
LRGEAAYLKEKRARLARSFAQSVLRFSVTANLVWRARDRMLASEIGEAETALVQHAPAGLPLCSIGPKVERPATDDAVADELVAIWKRCSLQLHRTCRGHGIRYFHFLQPNQYVAGAKAFTREERRIALEQSEFYGPPAREGYRFLIAAGEELRARGVSQHDLTRIFADVEEPTYVDSCCHLNRRGNDLLAAAIGRRIFDSLSP